jgi:hypothetical protein
MESTNISAKKTKPYTLNLTVGMALLGFLSCVLGFVLVFKNMETAEFMIPGFLFVAIAVIFFILMIIGGLRKSSNTSKLPWIYLVILLIVTYVLIRMIWVSSTLASRTAAIIADEATYTTQVARDNAVQLLHRKTTGMVVFGILSLIGMGFFAFFATKKALDGESRWPYALVFGLTLLSLYLMAYCEGNILNNVTNMTPYFLSNFFESRTCSTSLVAIYVISRVNDYDPEEDPTFQATSKSL